MQNPSPRSSLAGSRQSLDSQPQLITPLDVRLAVSMLVCFLVATVLSEAGVTFAVGQTHLDIIQRLAACITCLLCCQEELDASKHAGLLRLAITAIGGLTGVAVVVLDTMLGCNPWVLALLTTVGVLATLVACKAVGIPYVNARIGALTCLVVSSMLGSAVGMEARVWYAVFRLLSTLFGALVVVVVTKVMGQWPSK